VARKKTTPKTLAQAMACAKKVSMGQACTMAELKATVMLMRDGLTTARRKSRELKDRVSFLRDMVKR
jgi:hypothetical protein|tara:strand:- start:134 stop:334 length:201 start_codon:yes stop_codon:yes gene_type:complete